MKRRVVFAVILLFSFNKYLPAQSLWQNVRFSHEKSNPIDSASPTAKTAAPPIWVEPNAYTAATIDIRILESILKRAPKQNSRRAIDSPCHIDLLLPDGSQESFEIVETFVMHPDLAKKYPQIKTYKGKCVNNDMLRVRFDWTMQGFHAQFSGPNGYYYIDPHYKNNRSEVVSYFKEDARRKGPAFKCLTHELEEFSVAEKLDAASKADGDNITLRTYRLACAATAEYTAYHSAGTPTVAEGLAAVVTAINRVTGVMEKELALQLELVAENDQLIFTNASTDPYTNDDVNDMLSQNQVTVDSIIGSGNYDLGHVVGTSGGGIAYVDVACLYNWKARGATGISNPVGDQFTIGYICHEMGHQLGAEHTFNGKAANCSDNRSVNSAYEPGSGTTIMSYGGICGSDNLPYNSEDYFHWTSIKEITSTSAWSTCGTHTAQPNHHPTVDAGANAVIPVGTPFELTPSSYGDQDADLLTFCWEQADKGPAQYLSDPDNGLSPLFRSWYPTLNPTRTFPHLEYLLGNTMPTGEKLPAVSRTMAVKLTVRDNAPGGGGMAVDEMFITVSDAGGPFVVTSQNSPTVQRGTIDVTWNVANTTAAPISTSLVNILLSIDGGYTFDTVLAANTPNDGAQTVTIPEGISTPAARIKISAANSIFFDINNVNFEIQDPSSDPVVDAGVDMITWSGRYVQLTPNVINNGAPSLTYAWSANPATGVDFAGGENTLAPAVTITKPTSNPSVVTLTLNVNGIEDTMSIDVYDNACKAGRIGLGRPKDTTDIAGDDCLTDLLDLAAIAEAWLNNSSLETPVAK